MKLDDFRTIFRSSFADSEQWQRWFFDTVATDPGEIYLAADRHGKAASALMMQTYDFLYQGQIIPSAYISCVATLPECRSQGLSSKVLSDALSDACSRGIALCSLIPAEPHLFDFYARRGFSPVYYCDRGHYTSVHTFRGGCGISAAPDYEIFHALETSLGCGVLHSRQDFAEIQADMAIDGGARLIAMTDTAGSAHAMLFAADATDGSVRVKCLLADTPALAEGALARLREISPGRDITVCSPPLSGEKALMQPYGMMRVTQPRLLLETLAQAHPRLKAQISLADPLLPQNTATYTLADGRCSVAPFHAAPDGLEVDPATFAAILFGSHDTGRILGIPSHRPFMALMLD